MLLIFSIQHGLHPNTLCCIALKESHADEVKYHNTVLAELSSRLTRTQQRVDTLYDEKIDGNISSEFYDKKFAQYAEELDTITTSIQKHKNANVSYIELGSAIIDLTQRAEKLYREKATPEQKRKLLNIVFKRLLLKDKVVTPEFNPAFKFIAERVNTLNSEEFTLEPKISSNKAVTLESELNSERWLGALDDLRTPTWVDLVKYPGLTLQNILEFTH